MRKILAFICFSLLLTTCDDGDIIIVEFLFDETFGDCGELVLFKIKNDPAESLSLNLTSPSRTFEDLLVVGEDNTIEFMYTINGTSNRFNFRSYNVNVTGEQVFCNNLPPSEITITNDAESITGTVLIETALVEDDNDGIPAEMEDINGNGDLDDDDTDNDGIPNYLDSDDDGDNVLTIDEDENLDADDNPFTNPLDTDDDGVFNYLDNDDDNDCVLTRDEENFFQDLNPTNDITDLDLDIADYLNSDVFTTVTATEFRIHLVSQTFETIVTLFNVQLPELTQTPFDFGTRVVTDIVARETIFN